MRTVESLMRGHDRYVAEGNEALACHDRAHAIDCFGRANLLKREAERLERQQYEIEDRVYGQAA